MNKSLICKFIGALFLGLFLGACASKEKEEVLPAGKHRVLVRLTARSVEGLDAQYTIAREAGTAAPVSLGAGSARNNATDEVDSGIQSSGETIFVEISFRAITPTSTVRPNPAASYAVEIVVDGSVKTRVVINAASQLNNTYYLAAVAKTTL